MAALSIQVPYPVFYDRDGQPLDNGNIYIGVANLDPVTNPLQVYYDDALTIAASQPLITSGGYVYRNGTPAQLYVNATDFSITVNDSKNLLVYNFPEGTGISPNASGVAFTGFKGQVGTVADLADADGSDWIGFTPSGVNAVARSAQDKMRESVSVKDFGAIGDGVTDDTAAIQDAIDAIATAGGELLFPAGTYLITSSISKTFADGVNIQIRGYGAKIDATAVSSLNVIELGGSRVSSTALGANVSKNSDTFTVSSASGITGGRILLISSTDLWNPTRPEYLKGELALVEKIVGTTITNSNPLYDGYTAATTTVHLLNMPQITVEGLEIECNDDVIALTILYARSPVVRNCKIHGSRYAGVYVGYCLGGTVDSNFIYDVWNGIVTGTSYGVVVGTGQGVKVVNNTINNARHAISGGGFEPLREVVYANNTCHNSTLENSSGCIDLHGNVEMAVVIGNIASSINCASINTIISDNIINGSETDVPGILIFQEIDSAYYIIKGNRVAALGSNAYGIWVAPTEVNLNAFKIIIEGNYIISTLNSILIQPRSSAATGCSITTLSLTGNQLLSNGSAQAFVFANNGAATYSITEFMSTSNMYHAGAFDAFTCLGNPIGLTISTSDIFKANRLNTYMAYFCGTDVRLVSPTFYGNAGGIVGDSRSVYYDNSGRITVLNPVYKNLTFKAEIASATEYVENGWYGITPTILNTGGARLINFYGTLGRAITYGTAAPTVNTWARGDRVYNQDPTVGQPKSWVCTVAGTPGTWVSEGNL
jgi:hypothetical protein